MKIVQIATTPYIYTSEEDVFSPGYQLVVLTDTGRIFSRKVNHWPDKYGSSLGEWELVKTDDLPVEGNIEDL